MRSPLTGIRTSLVVEFRNFKISEFFPGNNVMAATKAVMTMQSFVWPSTLLLLLLLKVGPLLTTTPDATSPPLNCSAEEFACADRLKCIPLKWKCDLSVDCMDGSDEPSDCPPAECQEGHFSCKDSEKCIPEG